MNVKIFSNYTLNKKSYFLISKIISPVISGAIYNNIPSLLDGDDTENHISDKYYLYGEFTALYWIWKNIDISHYGFCMADTYFIFNNNYKNNISKTFFNKKNEYLPYITEGDYPEDATVIADRCFILNGVTIHHNCHIGLGNIPNSISKDYDTVICSKCNLNGFVHVGKGAELSSGTFVREWMCIAPGAFTAMGEHIVKNVPPFAKILKNRNCGIYEERLALFNVSIDDLKNIKSTIAKEMSY